MIETIDNGPTRALLQNQGEPAQRWTTPCEAVAYPKTLARCAAMPASFLAKYTADANYKKLIAM